MTTADIIEKLQDSYKKTEIKKDHSGGKIPQNREVIKIIKLTKDLVFPGYFTDDFLPYNMCKKRLVRTVNKLKKVLKKQIVLSRLYLTDEQDASIYKDESCEICQEYFAKIPEIREMVAKDVEAHFAGDPAALNRDQVIISYPGVYAILIYRIAHTLDNLGVQVIPRMMSEFAHRETGIDINPKAKIGDSFFIDHGTGVVIGETAIIGDNVKIYQGVTLGAMSLRKGKLLQGTKRHPTIENDVTIYSNASILGGKTVVGENSVIGSNVLVMKSIPKNSVVTNKEPELELRSNKKNENIW